MKIEKARALVRGTVVQAPKVGIKAGEVLHIINKANPKTRCVVVIRHIESDREGNRTTVESEVNYRLVEPGDSIEATLVEEEPSVWYAKESVIGYPDGMIKTRGGEKPITSKKLNLYFIIGELAYDVHPYRSDLGGWPVRWSEKLESYQASGH